MFAKSLAAVTLALLSTTALAAPISSPIAARQAPTGPVTITLIDATSHHWPITIPSTQVWTLTNVAESISHVHIENEGTIPCTFYGVDGAEIVSSPGDVKDMDVGAPQTIVGGICGPCTFE